MDYFRAGRAAHLSPDGRAARLERGRQRRGTLHAPNPRSRHRARMSKPSARSGEWRRSSGPRIPGRASPIPRSTTNWRTFRARRAPVGRRIRRPRDHVLYDGIRSGLQCRHLAATQDRRLDRGHRHRRQPDRPKCGSLPTADFDPPNAAAGLARARSSANIRVDSPRMVRLWILTNDDHVNFRIAQAQTRDTPDAVGRPSSPDRIKRLSHAA